MNLKNFLNHLRVVAAGFSIALGTLPQNNLQQNSNYNVLFSAENKIWIYQEDSSLYEELPIRIGDAKLGDMYITNDHKYLYYGLYHSNSPSELHRFDFDNNVDSILFENPNLSRFSPPSPENKHTVLSLVDLMDSQNPTAINMCVLNILDGNCTSVGIDITFEDFYWLGNNKFATVLLNGIKIYELDSTASIKILASYTSDSNLGASAITPNKRRLIIYSSGNPTNGYQSFISSYDIADQQMEILPIDLSYLSEAINRIEVSPDGTFLAYKYADTLVVTDLVTGVMSREIDSVQNFIWLSVDNILLTNVEDSPFTKILHFDVRDGTLTEVGKFNSEISFVALST